MATNIPYDIQALKANLDRCDANIQIFRDAIEKEKATKREIRMMIGVLEDKAKRQSADD